MPLEIAVKPENAFAITPHGLIIIAAPPTRPTPAMIKLVGSPVSPYSLIASARLKPMPNGVGVLAMSCSDMPMA